MNYRRAATVFGLAILVIFEVLVASTSAQAPQAAQAKAAPRIVGTWKLNYEKSNMRIPPPGVFQIRQYRLREDGFLVGLLITSGAQGRISFLQFTAKSDGKDYPEYSDDIVAEMIATGKPTTRTYSERIIDEYATEWVDKVNGRITAQGKKTISQDGKTMTITNDSNPLVQIYDRQ